MKTSFRQLILSRLNNHPSFYTIARTSHRIYCKISEPIHSEPNFIIIGVDKGGTSSLYDYLIQHPDIYSCVVKEPNYFAMYYDRDLSWYKSCFPLIFNKIPNTKFITGEASTQYYWYPYTAERIKKLFPKIKLIILLRNPIDRSYSHYSMNVRGGKEKLTFEDAIEKEHERIDLEYKKILKNPYYFSPKYSLQAYLSKSIYIDILPRWFENFSKSQLLILKSEDFYENPDKIYNKTLSFLNLEPHHLKKYPIVRKGKYDNINEKTRKKLLEFFRPYNEKLYKYLGRNFEWDS